MIPIDMMLLSLHPNSTGFLYPVDNNYSQKGSCRFFSSKYAMAICDHFLKISVTNRFCMTLSRYGLHAFRTDHELGAKARGLK